MSIQLSSYLKAVFTNMIFYERSRKTCTKRKPLSLANFHANQTKTANPIYCHNLSKHLRQALGPHVSMLHQRSVQQDFTDVLRKWISGTDPTSINPAHNLPHISGFDFNEDSSISDRWRVRFKVEPVAKNLLQLHIPSFVPWDVIAAPAQTTRIVCNITAASCNILQPAEQGCIHYSFVIPYDNHLLPARVIPLSIPSADGYLCITTVGLQYELKNGRTYNRPAYMPCSVIDARYR
jgi:hypothetical protein